MILKKYFYLLIFTLFLCYACSDDDMNYPVYSVSVQLVYPAENGHTVEEGTKVKLKNNKGGVFTATTNSSGVATFDVPAGIYDASASDSRPGDKGNIAYLYNGIAGNIIVTQDWSNKEPIDVNLIGSKSQQLIIKELYVGGCQNNEGNKAFQHDKYVILYNNSALPVTLDNLCLGMVLPYNSSATNNDYEGGVLKYEDKGWIPAGTGIWYFPNELTVGPGKEVVIALSNAVNHLGVYENSINFANQDYYCTYDISVYANVTYYPSPSESIPTSHYLKAVHYGAGNAWPLSNSGPAFFIFRTEGTNPVAFANNKDNTDYHGNISTASTRKKVPVDWILDGIEVFTTSSDKNQKRLTAAVDGGYTYLTNTYGYSSYRNINEEVTRAIEENEGKLVTGYTGGTEIDGKPSTDPSGIDAEASIKNGARIVYMDTNNSSDDFHQRARASLRDKNN